MSGTPPMSLGLKALIGACGGLCFALSKLMDAGFYMDQVGPVMKAGYLMAGAYVVLAALNGMFLEEAKRRKLFLQSLLAPSLVLAIIQGSAPPATDIHDEGTYEEPSESINFLGGILSAPVDALNFFLPSAVYAQDDSVLSDTASPPPLRLHQVKTVDESDIVGGVGDGFMYLLGRKAPPTRKSVVVLGRTASEKRARVIANQVDGVTGPGGQQVEIIQMKGDSTFYLTFGGIQSNAAAFKSLDEAKTSAFMTLSDSTDSATANAAKLILKAKSIDARRLLNKKPQ